MTINFDLVIETEEDSVDMKAGLATMQGVSDALRCAGESILTERVPERLTPKSNVRTSLKRSFKGSYGHIFSLDVHSEELQSKLNRIGRLTFIELISYFIGESLYRDSRVLSEKAKKVLDGLGDTSEKLVQQLRMSSLENIHEISAKFNHDVKIRYRQSRDEQIVIAEFDQNSAQVLQAEISEEEIDLRVVITRLNIHTGNGRLQIEGQNETVAFGFDTEYKVISVAAKKIFSNNLDHNNGLAKDKWKYLKVTVSPVKLKDDKVIKYIVKEFYEN